MLLLHCPYCGPRWEQEFQCRGEAHVTRPTPSAEASEEAWASYLYLRTNPKGLHYERWLHTHGCRRWFNVARSTVTHAIVATYRPGEPKPELKPEPKP